MPEPEIAAVQVPDLPTLRLLELPQPNVGDYSPTEVHRVEDFRAGLLAMHAPGFDGRRIVVTEVNLSGPFTRAGRTALVYGKDGFHLTAESAGPSLLVLPIQYSHCWSAVDAGAARLFRANLMQLGVAFSGRLDTRLVFRFGPTLAADCRAADLDDMTRLKIKEARGPVRQPQ